MDHKEAGTVNKSPVLHPDSDFYDWKEMFYAFCDYQDINIWTSIIEGYGPPQTLYNGRMLPTPYSGLNDEQKELFRHEKKAMATLKMTLTKELLHQVKKFSTAKEMFDAVEKIYVENEDIKKKKEGAEEKVEMGDADEFVAEFQDKSDTVSHSCSNCTVLQVKVDTLSEQNKALISELDKVKEQNLFLKNNEAYHNRRIKELEKERSLIKSELIKQLNVVDLAYVTTKEQTEEIASKTKELLEAKITIAELNRKIEQFRSSSFVLDHMIGSQKPNGKGQGVGYTEVPPPGNYSFVPKDETELMNFVSTSVKEVDPITVN